MWFSRDVEYWLICLFCVLILGQKPLLCLFLCFLQVCSVIKKIRAKWSEIITKDKCEGDDDGWKCFPAPSVIPVIGKIRIAPEWGTLVTSGPPQISTVEAVLLVIES